MSSSSLLFTSESVSEGQPDKVADQISDAMLDAFLAQDKYARVAAETLCTTGLVVLAGEVTSNAVVDYQAIARETIISTVAKPGPMTELRGALPMTFCGWRQNAVGSK